MYPLSQDKSQVIETIRNLSPNNFSFQGSNLEKAIEKSLLSFSNANTDKIIIILSDGEIFDGNSGEYADECRDKILKASLSRLEIIIDRRLNQKNIDL
jgi:predicted HTH transcriptional regulator